MKQLTDDELEVLRERAMNAFRAFGREHPMVHILMAMGVPGNQAVNQAIDRMSYFAGINDALSWLLGNESPNMEHLASLECSCGKHEGLAPNGDAVAHLNKCLKQSES